MSNRSSLRKKMIEEGILKHQEWRKNMINKNMGRYNNLSYSCFLNYVWQAESKIIALSNMILNIYKYFKLGKIKWCKGGFSLLEQVKMIIPIDCDNIYT